MTHYVTDNQFKREAYLEKIFREGLPSSFFLKFAGVSEIVVNGQTGHISPIKDNTSTWSSPGGTPVVVFRDLNANQRGALVRFPIINALIGEGLKGSNNVTLEDNLERIVASQFEMTLEEHLHGVTAEDPLARQEAYFSILTSCAEALTAWGIENIDNLCFKELEHPLDSTSSNILYAGTATNVGGLTENDKISIDLLRKAKLMARSGFKGTGAARTNQKYSIEPYKYGGKDYYFVVMHPDCMYDLQKDAEFQDAMKYAADRGKDNPLFTGVDAITMDGLAIFSHPRAYITDPNGSGEADWGSGASVAGAKISILGQNALAIALGKAPEIRTQTKDFTRFVQYGYQGIYNVKKIAFNGNDYGSFEIRCARSRVSDKYRNP